ncbi:MAG: alpha/beta fold hydrolase, partial [Acidobacteriaceae bacterium]|nr:alpha/beta fold hydrolase [Acidobacteriaceae bacterium]
WTLFKENRQRHFVILNVQEQAHTEFISDLQTYFSACSDKQALVFVHGFNVTFAAAVFRTAQIAADLNFPGAPILFSWPSKATLSPTGYTHDETQARWTLPDLRAFLELLAEHSGATTIHLLAHSMGNRALTEALCQIGIAAANAGSALFNEIILTAPDIDSDTFTRDIAPAVLPTAKRVTLYASSNDEALKFSKAVHGYHRAGESGENVIVLPGVDTVDVSMLDTNLLGHSYYGDNRSVLSDMFNLIKGEPAAGRFGLRKHARGQQHYWVFQP